MAGATTTIVHWSCEPSYRRSIDAGIGIRRQPELRDGDSPEVKAGVSPSTSAIETRKQACCAALEGELVSGGPVKRDEVKSRSAGESTTRPNWETRCERNGAAHTGAALPAITSASKALQPVPKVSHIGIEKGEATDLQPIPALLSWIVGNLAKVAVLALTKHRWEDGEKAMTTRAFGQLYARHITVTLVAHGAAEESAVNNQVFVTEPALVPDTFATGLLPVERGDGWFRLTYYASKTDTLMPKANALEHNVVARIILPWSGLFLAAATARESIPELRDQFLLNG